MGSMGEPDIPKPWIVTPLKESSALSRSAGWYELLDLLCLLHSHY
jgi:hypothetical protein